VWGLNCLLYAKDGCLDCIYENANNYLICPHVRRLKLYSQLEIATRDLVMLACTFVLLISACKKCCSILWCHDKNMIKSLHNLELSSTKEIKRFRYWIGFNVASIHDFKMSLSHFKTTCYVYMHWRTFLPTKQLCLNKSLLVDCMPIQYIANKLW
jgi:hypothetical protein